MLNFFQDSTKNFLDDDAFYKLDNISGTASGLTATHDLPSAQTDAASSFFEQLNSHQSNTSAASAKHVSQKQAGNTESQTDIYNAMHQIQNSATVGAANN